MTKLAEKIRPYIKALRLTHQPGILVLFFFGVLDAGLPPLRPILEVALGLLAGSVAMFLLNDIADAADTDRFSHRDKALTKEKIPGPVAATVWIILAAITLLLLSKHGLVIQALLLLVFGVLYSLPPFRFKARFPFDLISAAVWVVAGYSAGFGLTGSPLINMLNPAFFSLASVLFCSELIHLIADRKADKKAGLRNSAVVLSPNTLLRLAKITLMLSAVGVAGMAYWQTGWWYYPLIPIIPYIGYALGRLREVMYKPQNGAAVFNTAYHRGIKIGNVLVLYQIILIIYLASR